MHSTPNIIYILCDDLGWGDVSCYNNDSKIKTPNIDKLADSGIKFTDAHAGSAVCTPSRYNLLTGRYAWRTRELKESVNGGYSPALIRQGRKNIASVLQSRNYHSACIGKWHIGMDWHVGEGVSAEQILEDELLSDIEEHIDFRKPVRNSPCSIGFDYFYGISASLDMPPYTWIENDRVVTVPDTMLPGETGERKARAGMGTADWQHEKVLPTLMAKAKKYIVDRAAQDNPFFLYLPINGPHTPIVPNKEWLGKSGCGIYGDFVMEIDDMVGQLVDTVYKLGISEETIIVFTSDNGPETLTSDYREKYGHRSTWEYRGMKRDNWEGGHRVPYIVSWQGTFEHAGVIDSFVELGDFAATICDIIGIEREEDFCEDSFSMLPLIINGKKEEYRTFSIHHSCDGKWAVRKGKWKALLHSGSGGNEYDCPENNDPVQLYDMENDPYETTNIYKQHPDIISGLRKLCLECIYSGRSTHGEKQPLEEAAQWKQLEELLEFSELSYT